jgi:hypothetical protein
VIVRGNVNISRNIDKLERDRANASVALSLGLSLSQLNFDDINNGAMRYIRSDEDAGLDQRS